MQAVRQTIESATNKSRNPAAYGKHKSELPSYSQIFTDKIGIFLPATGIVSMFSCRSKNRLGPGVAGSDNSHYSYSCRRHHDRAVTGLWLACLHDGQRGTRQVSQSASLLARQQTLLDSTRGSARAFATTCTFATTRTRGGALAFPTTRYHDSARASPTT